MEKFITKSQAEELKKTVKDKKHYGMGELHPYMFDYKENPPKLEDEDFKIVSQLGTYVLKKTELPKIICPICGKEEIVPYFCGASVLSGSHVIKAFCHSCGEQIAFNDNTYYHNLLWFARENGEKQKAEFAYSVK